ncbi:MAG: hypothetical protein FWG56_03610 [Desulfovibrionaceae bacterium]|jgi:hypothetical protein|nr:hypothetical protein [Desulfovibrionaceae bacterium]
MMGRLLILLIVANLAWAAWSQGWLHGGARQQAEPERLERQIRPEAVQIQPLPDGAASSPVEPAAPPAQPQRSDASEPAAPPVEPAAPASAPASDPQAGNISVHGICLQAGVFDDKQIEAVRRAAAAELPAGSWRISQVPRPSRWMIYVGKLADADAVRVKRVELRALGVDSDHPSAALEPGLSLGRFVSEDAAQRGLADLGRKGVRGARVVQERRDAPAYVLRLPETDAALRQQAARAMRGALGSKEWRVCE